MATEKGQTGSSTSQPTRGPTRRHYVAALVGAGAFFVVWLLRGAPTEGPMWDLLLWVAGWASVAAVVGTSLTILVDRALWVREWMEERTRLQQSAILVSAVVVVAAVVAATAAVVFRPGAGPCDAADELRILTSPSQLAATETLAEAYEQWTAVNNDGCPTVRTHVYATPTDAAVSALTTGWTSTDEVAPRPDVWFAEGTADVEQVSEGTEGPDIELVGLDSNVVAASPLVLAVARSALAGLTGEGSRQSRTWQGWLDVAENQGWELVRPHPEVSRVGALAVTALYGGSDEPGLVDFARNLEQEIGAQAQAGYRPLADTGELLSHYRAEGSPGTALLVSEQAMVRSNLDDPRNVDCRDTATSDPRPTEAAGGEAPNPLIALYPTDTLTTDVVVVALTWRHQARQALAAASFRTWLGENGQRRLAEIGLRPPGFSLTDRETPLNTPACGAVPDALPTDQPSRPPSAGAPERAAALFLEVQRPGRILLAMDLSGSMGRDAPGGAVTRHELATGAVEGAVRRLGEQDELGLWAFHHDDWEPLVPTGPGAELHEGMPRGEAAVEALAGLTPGGETPLYKTIVGGVEVVGSQPDRITALVVVTDGEDTSSGPADEEALEALDETVGARVFVVAVGEASCQIDAIAEVTGQTDGDCVEADFQSLDSQLSELFAVIWSGAQP